MRVVVDTNILVSGLLTPGPCRQVMTSFKQGAFLLIFSPLLLKEFTFVINRSKFKSLLDTDEIFDLIRMIESDAVFVHPKSINKDCRDPKDNHLLDILSTTPVNCLVTGDKDLLILNPWKGIRVVSPKEFLKLLK